MKVSVGKRGDQRPGSIIVKINRKELEREVREKRRRKGDAHKAKEKGRTEATRGRGGSRDGRVLCVGGSVDDQLGHNA